MSESPALQRAGSLRHGCLFSGVQRLLLLSGVQCLLLLSEVQHLLLLSEVQRLLLLSGVQRLLLLSEVQRLLLLSEVQCLLSVQPACHLPFPSYPLADLLSCISPVCFARMDGHPRETSFLSV